MILDVGNDVFIGMQASVTQDVQDGSVIVGDSGKVLLVNDRRAKLLKKKYFNV